MVSGVCIVCYVYNRSSHSPCNQCEIYVKAQRENEKGVRDWWLVIGLFSVLPFLTLDRNWQLNWSSALSRFGMCPASLLPCFASMLCFHALLRCRLGFQFGILVAETLTRSMQHAARRPSHHDTGLVVLPTGTLWRMADPVLIFVLCRGQMANPTSNSTLCCWFLIDDLSSCCFQLSFFHFFLF